MRDPQAPTAPIPDIPTRPSDLGWVLLECELAPLIEEIVDRVERMMKAPTRIMLMQWV